MVVAEAAAATSSWWGPAVAGAASGIIGGLFGGRGRRYNANLGRQYGYKAFNNPNDVLQARQDEVLANENVARLISPEGRAEIFQGITSRLDKSYQNAMTLGSSSLSRAGLGSGSASALLRARMTRERMESVNDASSKSDLAAGQFAANLFGDFRKEHLQMNLARANYEMGLQGGLGANASSQNSLTGTLGGSLIQSGALNSTGNWLSGLFGEG